MSLDTVVEDIRDEARAQAEEIREDGERRAEEILEEARNDAASIREERETKIERQVKQEREQTLSAAKLEAKQQRLEARRDVLEDVRERVEAELAAMEGDTREQLTRELLDAAAEEFDENTEASVYGRTDDADLLEDVLADYEGYSLAGEYDCLGGVVVESDGSKVRVNNTFDSLLDSVWEDNLKEISARLFENEQ